MRLLSELLEYLKIKELYPPQKEAIALVEKGNSVLMSVPTAAGKTLVAYAALIKAVKAKKKGMYLVPLRALAWEKVNELKDICKKITNVGFQNSQFIDLTWGISTIFLGQKNEK